VPIPDDPRAAWQTDWSRMARLIVHQALQTQPGERVLLHADPTYFPALTEQVRIEINRAGAVELATVMLHPPGLERVRRQLRRREDPTLRRQEDAAMAGIFALADIYIWLPTHWSYNLGQTEDILTTWRGRSIHFHWIMDQVDAGLFRTLSDCYDRALYLDYAALTARQRRLIEALRTSTVEITDPRGTRLRFELSNAHFHVGNGDASKGFVDGYARPGSARDREVELPCGAIRTVDVTGAEGVVVTPPETFAGREVGSLRLEFHRDRITRITSEHHAAWVEAVWGADTGDKDRIGEVNLGVSPALRMLPGVSYIPYYGYGEGIVRLSLGDNAESGGRNRSSYHHWLFLTDATVTANGRPIVQHGELLGP
jgi:leucyl aminopeptidase (aminopeptidase T)